MYLIEFSTLLHIIWPQAGSGLDAVLVRDLNATARRACKAIFFRMQFPRRSWILPFGSRIQQLVSQEIRHVDRRTLEKWWNQHGHSQVTSQWRVLRANAMSGLGWAVRAERTTCRLRSSVQPAMTAVMDLLHRMPLLIGTCLTQHALTQPMAHMMRHGSKTASLPLLPWRSTASWFICCSPVCYREEPPWQRPLPHPFEN